MAELYRSVLTEVGVTDLHARRYRDPRDEAGSTCPSSSEVRLKPDTPCCSRLHSGEQQRRRDEGERAADAERGRGADRVPDRAEDDACGERAEALHGVVNAEREAAAFGWREIGNERLFSALREAEIEPVQQEPCEQSRQRCARREP